jgi:NADPH-dependent 2,4-dienoyl-CoA reductase/sulfur reductase-like enzyme
MNEAIPIDFEGERIEARPGESLAAALAGRGILAFRSTRCGAERGIFCGMGICQDCLVEVDGRPAQRACMTLVDRPLTVRRESHARPLPSTIAAAVSAPVSTERPDVLVIGGGPGGLAAAIAASKAGASVTLIDERSKAGGQYFKQLGVSGAPEPDRQHREGLALVETARRAGVDLRGGVLVWGAFEGEGFVAVAGERSLRFQPKAAIIATGAYERPWPIPGWTLPGVMTTGAAQTLWRTARRLPGRRVLIAGNGPLNLQLAAELIEGGAEVVGVIEAAARPGLRHLGTLASMFTSAPRLVCDGVRYHAGRRAGGTDVLYGQVAAAIARSGSGLIVDLAAADSMEKNGRRFEVDVVCLGYGFEPANELLRLLGCGHDYDPERRHLVTRRHEGGRTDVAGIYALGDCTGLGGARVALAEGTIAGLAAAAEIGYPATAVLQARRQEAETALRRHRRFQRALWTLYRAPQYSAALATPETLICRCEEVSFGEVEAAVAEGMQTAGAIKRRTRLGMGRCQARYCGPVLEALLESRCGRTRGEFSGFAPRVPVKPLPIGMLTQASDRSTD